MLAANLERLGAVFDDNPDFVCLGVPYGFVKQ
jgi:hypothetical protein